MWKSPSLFQILQAVSKAESWRGKMGLGRKGNQRTCQSDTFKMAEPLDQEIC